LSRNGIVWQQPYEPLHLWKTFAGFARGEFPQSMKYWVQAVHLPLFSFMKAEEARFVIDVVKKSF